MTMPSQENSSSPPSSRKYLKLRSTPCSPKLPRLSQEMFYQALEKPGTSAAPEKSKRESTFVRTSPTPSGTLLQDQERQSQSSKLRASASYLEMYQKQASRSTDKDGQRDIRKAKTIFSMDTRYSRAQVESGIGDGGNGVKVDSPVMPTDKLSSSVSHAKTSSSFSHSKTEEDITAHLDWYWNSKLRLGNVKLVGLPDPCDSREGASVEEEQQPSRFQSLSGYPVSHAKTEEDITAHLDRYWDSKVRLGKVELVGLPDPSESPSQEEVLMEPRSPRLKSLNGYIGILPESNSYPRSSAPTGYDLNSMFNLTLRRSSIKNGEEFRESVQIHNMTRFLHAYKVCCNSSAYSKLNVVPAMGLIRSNEQISFEIRAKDPLASSEMVYDPIHDKAEIKIFRYNCFDPDKQRKYFEDLQVHRPDLISTQTIQKILLWDFGNLSDTLELLNSIDADFDDDDDEQASMDTKLIYYKLGQYPPPLGRYSSRPSYKAGLILAKNQLLTTSYNLREASITIRSLRQGQAWMFFVMIFYFLGPWLYSILDEDRHALLAKAEAATWPTMMINIIGQNLFNLTKTD